MFKTIHDGYIIKLELAIAADIHVYTMNVSPGGWVGVLEYAPNTGNIY